MVFRILNGIMVLLFAVAVAVQYNDPDPIRWMAIYGAACLLSGWAALRGAVPFAMPIVVAVIALAWSLDVGYGVAGLVAFSDMFQSWEMKSPTIEEAREASGLMITCVWMAVLAVHARIRTR